MSKNSQSHRQGTSIMRNLLLGTLVLALGGLTIAGCAEPGPDIDRTQTNLVDKSIFQGEWWHTRAVLELDDDASWAIEQAGSGAPWPGALANFDIASNSGTIGRIRWVIDENFLYAYRSHEIVAGAAEDATSEDYLGQPLAIYAITDHVDVRYEYNSITGERTNVVGESTDRRWYDRQYMRVDWSTNLVSFGLFGAGLELDQYFGTFTREPVTSWIQEGGDERIPESWRPQFVRIGDDRETYRWAAEWPADMDDTVHYMSFVTQEIWTPLNCFGEACNSSIRLTLRNSFLRVPPEHEYAAETLTNSEYDRFGIIRTEQRTFIRGGRDRAGIGAYCDGGAVAVCNFDEECGAGGACDVAARRCTAGVLEDVDDCGAGNAANYATGRCENDVDSVCGGAACNMETHLCEGGLSAHRGETDFLTFYRLRHNFYGDSLQNDRPCIADWQCDNRHGTVAGADPAMTDGSVCDTAAGLCTIPVRERPVRPVDYRLSADFPRYLVRSAFEVISEWNLAFMEGNRGLHGQPVPTGPSVACQNVNPGAYCFCGEVDAPEVRADRTCAHRSDMFVEPSARGEENPYDCWIAIRGADGATRAETGAENPTNPTSFDDYPEDVYRYAFVGTECMLRLHVNSCNVPVAEGEAQPPCEEYGDLRHQFFNYVSGAGAGWCGVMQPLQDPTNGEAITIPVNMGGLCLDNIATRAIDLWPVLRGEVTEDALYTGENMRGYYERTGNVHVPVGYAPSIDGAEYQPEDLGRPAGMLPANLNAHINDVFANLSPRFEQLRGGIDGEGRAQIHSDRLRNLAGTSIERRLVEGMRLEGFDAVRSENPLMANNLAETGVELDSEAMLDRVSPFRDGFRDLIRSQGTQDSILADNYICHRPREAIFTSRYNQWWAEAFRGRSAGEAGVRWRQAWHRAIMLHEMGHGLGLEHNFAGSYDRNHYGDGYFNIVTQLDAAGDHTMALPVLDNYDCGVDGLCPGDAGYTRADAGERDNNITDAEVTRWANDLRTTREARMAAGIGNTMTSSLMEYNGDFSDMYGLGHYDQAAVYYNYFNMVEAFQGDPSYRDGVGTSLETLLRSDITPRTLWTWYRGGEACNENVDCPYSQGSAALTSDQGIHQRCIRNPRYAGIPVPCDGDRNCICSNFDEDFIDYVEGAEPAYNWDADGDGAPDHERVRYMFCSNPRLNDISWCSVYDAGESFQETIDHWRQTWQEGYPRSYFRNYRRGFSTGSRALRSIIDAAKMYQHLFFRYFYEPEFRREVGPLGFNDQYLASIDAMNWLAELAQLPDVGSYDLQLVRGPDTCHPTNPDAPGNPESCRYGYVQIGEEMGMAGADMSLGPGQGFYTWSRYQDGLYGFFRMERAGVFWDKLVALQALTVRDWGLSFTIDERFFINFYDLFPIEMTELFGAYVTDDDLARAPRVVMDGGEPQIYYVNLLRGNCRSATTGSFEPCNGPVEERFPEAPIMGTSNEVMRLYASVFALAEFPVFYDPSFESRLAIFKLDSADGFTIPDVRLDGEPTQAFGQAVPGSGHAVTTDPVEADYIIYVSDRLHQPYVAVKVTERLTFNLEEEQIGFQLLLRLYNMQEEVRDLEARGTLTPEERAHLTELRRQLIAGESFLEALIEVQQIFGITSWL